MLERLYRTHFGTGDGPPGPGRAHSGAAANARDMLVLWRNRVLVDGRSRIPHVLAGDELEAFAPSTVFGGESGDDDDAVGGAGPAAPATLDFVALDPGRDGLEQLPDVILREAPLRFIDPIFELGRVGGDLRRTLVRSLAIARWSEANAFCSVCGTTLRWEVPGRVKICANADPHRHWPRLDPSAIMLVSDGDRMLLGRQAGWPAGMYSTLAGFVDQGESVEEAVAREVYEEAGITVRNITYAGSEPWPFPRSLMIGFFAEAVTTEIVRGDELEDVRWFTVEEGLRLQETLRERMPYADTIARRLIATWLERRSGDAAV